MLSHWFYPEVGGIETNSEILAAAFCNYNSEVHLVTWTKQEGSRSFPFVIIRNPSIKRLLQEHRWADVVFENNPTLKLSWPNFFIRKPLVIALNTWVIRLNGRIGLRDKLKKLWFARAKSVIAVSNAVRKTEWENAVIIENAYNNHLFKLQPDSKRTIKFVFLGRLVSDKGAELAIQAIYRLAEENLIATDETQLTIIGDGPERANLLTLIQQLKLDQAVHLTGVLQGQALVDYLNLHEYILVPSTWEEPFGNVVLEGMACGCLPITSGGGGLPEAVGKAGFTFKRKDLADFVRILKIVLQNPIEVQARRENIEKHLANHTSDRVAEKYFRQLKKVVNF